MMRQSHVSLLIVLLVAVLTLAACGSATTAPPSPSGSPTVSAKSVACDGLATINKALASLSETKSSTTVGDVQAAQQKVTNALNAIASKIPAASGPLLDQIKSANDQVAAKIAGYPPETPIGQTSVNIQNFKSAVATVQSKTTALASALQCPS